MDLERLGGVRLLGERRRLSLLGERLDRLAERRLRLLKLLLRLSGLLALFLPLQRGYTSNVAGRSACFYAHASKQSKTAS